MVSSYRIERAICMIFRATVMDFLYGWMPGERELTHGQQYRAGTI
ncbi:hypothetical protein X971_0492 [Agrobacterium tumefaciens LBA4213 (Ach5)]|nr:hypothetical protein X971_0492 [Agrobacterium tumefaciens LBA4213 (Ach5)]